MSETKVSDNMVGALGSVLAAPARVFKSVDPTWPKWGGAPAGLNSQTQWFDTEAQAKEYAGIKDAVRVRYVIRHHPGVCTDLSVEFSDGRRPQRCDTPDWTWAQVREYCRQSLEERGVKPVIERPERFVEVFPWVEVEVQS